MDPNALVGHRTALSSTARRAVIDSRSGSAVSERDFTRTSHGHSTAHWILATVLLRRALHSS
jgi:hypothetical protein